MQNFITIDPRENDIGGWKNNFGTSVLMKEAAGFLFGQGVWASKIESRRLWEKVLSSRCKPDDGLQDIFVSGRLFGGEHDRLGGLAHISTIAMCNGVYAGLSPRLYPNAFDLLPQAVGPTDEILRWISSHLDITPAATDITRKVCNAFRDLCGDSGWLLKTYGLSDKAPNLVWSPELKSLLGDCIHMGAAVSENEELRDLRLLPEQRDPTGAQVFINRLYANSTLRHQEAPHAHSFIRFVFSSYPDTKLEGAVICDEISKLFLQSRPPKSALDFTLAAFFSGKNLARKDPDLIQRIMDSASDGVVVESRKLFEWFIEGWGEGPSPEAVVQGMRQWTTTTNSWSRLLVADDDEAGLCLLRVAWDFVFWAGLFDDNDF